MIMSPAAKILTRCKGLDARPGPATLPVLRVTAAAWEQVGGPEKIWACGECGVLALTTVAG